MLPTATRTLIRAEVKTNDLHDNTNLHRFVVPALRDERIGRVFINRSTRDRSDLRPKCAASGASSLRDTTACPRLYRDQARIVAVGRRSEPSSERSFMDHEHSYRSPIGRKGARVRLPVPGSLNRAMPGCPGRRNASARATSCARRVRPEHMPLQRPPGTEPNGRVGHPSPSTKRRYRRSRFVSRTDMARATRPEVSPARAAATLHRLRVVSQILARCVPASRTVQVTCCPAGRARLFQAGLGA